ncbi:hypothetical protein [Piscirickettsia salmonis]|nr:hypothetical protein [Piscirickettsia salmonis]APS59083.1 hypothetical protein AVI52_17775 [Piscirickettsia salmonis]PEQ16277.1 hypothetical protein X973_08255 [Piscirickettsia salmonis]QGN79241.1 hypothetical protein Psal001_03506 [Piscirickettsia salmonis]QGN82832.1 hypothetical protein Psal002_03532 [Piscirickettsia salmonis]QGN86344.1 hypothetical protein Psal003_03453 [Piscirickettsia salmonis]
MSDNTKPTKKDYLVSYIKDSLDPTPALPHLFWVVLTFGIAIYLKVSGIIGGTALEHFIEFLLFAVALFQFGIASIKSLAPALAGIVLSLFCLQALKGGDVIPYITKEMLVGLLIASTIGLAISALGKIHS